MAEKRVAKKAVKKTAGGAKVRRRRVASYHLVRFHNYIGRVLKSVHPEIGISKRGMSVMNSFVLDLLHNTAEEASRLCKLNKTRTLDARAIQTATRLSLPGELSKHAVNEGQKALSKAQGKA